VGTTTITYTTTTCIIITTIPALHRRPLYHNLQFRLYIPTMGLATRHRVTSSHHAYLRRK
jgi:hypothetical protein